MFSWHNRKMQSQQLYSGSGSAGSGGSEVVWVSVILLILLVLLLLRHPLLLLLSKLDEKLSPRLAVTVQLKAIFASDRLHLLPRAWVFPPVEDPGRHGQQRHGHKDHCRDHTCGQEEEHTGLIIQDMRFRIQDIWQAFWGVSTFTHKIMKYTCKIEGNSKLDNDKQGVLWLWLRGRAARWRSV